MSFDISYIKRICSLDILGDDPNFMAKEAMKWIEQHDMRYEFEERAARLEYDGGLSRAEAEDLAFQEIKDRVQEAAE